MFTQVTTFHPKLLRLLTNQTRPILEQHYASLYNLPWCIEEIVYDPLLLTVNVQAMDAFDELVKLIANTCIAAAV